MVDEKLVRNCKNIAVIWEYLMKYASIENNFCKYVESVLFKLPNLIICFAKVYQIIKTKTYKTFMHLETVSMFR
jgi:hypothetical protein